jgi:hypothetical protein
MKIQPRYEIKKHRLDIKVNRYPSLFQLYMGVWFDRNITETDEDVMIVCKRKAGEYYSLNWDD